jgi:hypothetical protein
MIATASSAPDAVLVTGAGCGPTNGIYMQRNDNKCPHPHGSTSKEPALPVWFKDDQTYIISLEQEGTGVPGVSSGGICYAKHHRYWFSDKNIPGTSPEEGWNCDDVGRINAYQGLRSAGHKFFTPSSLMRKNMKHSPAPSIYAIVNPPKAARTCTSEWKANSIGQLGGQGHDFQIEDPIKQMTIDLGRVEQVIGFATQATAYWRSRGDQRVTKYTLETSADGQHFNAVDGGRVFNGPPSVGGRVRARGFDNYDVTKDTQDKDTAVHKLFQAPVTAQYVRLQVQAYEASSPSLRCAVL